MPRCEGGRPQVKACFHYAEVRSELARLNSLKKQLMCEEGGKTTKWIKRTLGHKSQGIVLPEGEPAVKHIRYERALLQSACKASEDQWIFSGGMSVCMLFLTKTSKPP